MAEVKREYYNSGELRYEVFVINDIKNGTYKEYFQNGQLAEMHTYITNFAYSIRVTVAQW